MGVKREVKKDPAGASAARDSRRDGHDGKTRAVPTGTTASDASEKVSTGRNLALYTGGGSREICLAPAGGGGGSVPVIPDGSEPQWLDDELPRDPAKLADELNFQYRCGQELVVEHACHLGRILLHAREVVGHGGFQDWVEDNCDFSYRTAADYMKVARYWEDVEWRLDHESPPESGYSLRWALKGLTGPRESRKPTHASPARTSSAGAPVALGDEGHAIATAPSRGLALPAPRPAAAAAVAEEENGSDEEDDEFIEDGEARGVEGDDEAGQGCDDQEDDEVPVSQSRRNRSLLDRGSDQAGAAGHTGPGRARICFRAISPSPAPRLTPAGSSRAPCGSSSRTPGRSPAKPPCGSRRGRRPGSWSSPARRPPTTTAPPLWA
jgi:hypothetical protein